MYALFARIAEDELEVPDESDPCDVAKTTVVIIKVREPRTVYPWITRCELVRVGCELVLLKKSVLVVETDRVWCVDP